MRGNARILCAMLPVLLVPTACSQDDGARGETQPPAEGDESRVLEAAADPADPICLQSGPFVADGAVPLRAPSGWGAAEISGFRWEGHDGCERFVIDLEAGDQAADSVGPATVELLRQQGVVRVTLPGVRRVAQEATEHAFDGSLARGAYAVWAPDGRSTYVDVHLAAPAEASAAVLEDPARIVVDLRSGGEAMAGPPLAGSRVVVLQPQAGEASYPLQVVGYARTFESNVVARLQQDGRTVREVFTTATAWMEAWGHFSLTLESGPIGAVELQVGEYSARDGTWEGVTVELRMR